MRCVGLTADQRRVIERSLGVAKRLGASPRERKALVEALGVESNYTIVAPGQGDLDSVGALQQRPSQGWGPSSESLETDVGQFLRAAQKINRGGFKGSAGSLAQAVQRSAYPGRYHARGGEADSLIAQFFGGSDPGAGGGQQTPSQGPTAAPDLPSLGMKPGPDTAGLLASLLGPERQAPPTGQLRPSATAAHAALPAGYQGIQTQGGPAPRQDLSGLLEAVSGLSPGGPGIQTPQTPGDAQNGGNPGGGSSKRRGRPGNGLGNAVSLVDGLVGEYGAPITAKQEPGHQAGGDHDPAVKGATARDIGGDEQTRRAIWSDLMGRLGVKGAQYKGADVNVTVGGVRYQVISRDHGSGPHLHIGMRRVGR